MPIETAKNIIAQTTDSVSTKRRKRVTILWHGGEPLLWGVENFKEIFSYTGRFADRVVFRHSIQTNLSLINDEFIELFKEYNVRVGFSLDGVKEINDAQRKKADGSGTFDVIMSKVDRCRETGLNVGVIIVASSAFKGRVKELYEFICSKRLNFKFNPLFISGEAIHCKDFSLSPMEYAQMSNELFDLWYNDHERQIKESTFIDIASSFLTPDYRTKGCMFSENCQDNFFAISPRGDVFPCGRFCETSPRHSYGNINNESLADILSRQKKSEPYLRSEFIKNSGCRQCEFYGLCHGGCLHDGFLTRGDFKSKTFLCAAYKSIFKHIQKRICKTFDDGCLQPKSDDGAVVN